MSTTERRHGPRTTIERLAYIHIEPNNGGIVLNVSPDGLCFHSIAPVERNGEMRFSILDHSRRIDAKGTLVWTDELNKVAGVRFTTITSEAREQVETWITNPGDPQDDGGGPTLGSAILRTIPDGSVRRPRPRMETLKTSASAAGLLRLRLRLRLAGFSAGMATGMVLSLVAVFGLLLTYSHRRQFGESLIRLGERLAARSAAVQSLSVSPPQAETPKLAQVDHATVGPPRPSLVKEEPHGKQSRVPEDELDNEPDVIQVPIQVDAQKRPVAPIATKAAPIPTTADPGASTGVLASAAALAPPRLPSSLSTAASLPATKMGSPNAPEVVVPNPSHRGTGPAEMYLDLGKFKDQLLARSIGNKLAVLGLPANITQKGHLWMNSYHVVVGPFASDEDASRARRMLTSLGYEPKPYERGSHNFFFSSRVTLNGTPLPQGEITVSWESSVQDAKVKFLEGNEVLAIVQGHWMPSAQKYSQDEFVYRKTIDNSKPLMELHFYGWNRTLVFHDASSPMLSERY
jgi:cell division protein FtsN